MGEEKIEKSGEQSQTEALFALRNGIDWFDSNDGSLVGDRLLKTPPQSATLSARQTRFLADVQLCLSIELGEIQLSAAEVIDLLPGQVFPYRYDPLKEMALRIGNDVIAMARLTLCDGIIGLEITRVMIMETTVVGNRNAESDDK